MDNVVGLGNKMEWWQQTVLAGRVQAMQNVGLQRNKALQFPVQESLNPAENMVLVTKPLILLCYKTIWVNLGQSPSIKTLSLFFLHLTHIPLQEQKLLS